MRCDQKDKKKKNLWLPLRNARTESCLNLITINFEIVSSLSKNFWEIMLSQHI